VEYEEWIYGTPPQDVEFIRFVGDEVVRIETMAVDGKKVVRTDPEVVIKKEEPEVAQGAPGQPPAGGDQAQGQAQPAATQDSNDGPIGKPSLKRPGEDPGEEPPVSNKPNPVPKSSPGGTTPPPGAPGTPPPG
jgi:hypothetical protein